MKMEKNNRMIKIEAGIGNKGRFHWVPQETVEQWIQKADDENTARELREWAYEMQDRWNKTIEG